MTKQNAEKPLKYSEYLSRLGNPQNDPSRAQRIFETALHTRDFEIENYWRRANYFWVVLAAIFTGYFAAGLVASSGEDTRFVRSILAGLGALFAWAWFFANKGSKFWQENWEAHVDLLEPLSHGLLFQTVIESRHKRPAVLAAAPYSVSRINALISLTVALIWSGLLFKTAWEWFDHDPIWALAGLREIVGIVLAVAAFLLPIMLMCLTRTGRAAGKHKSTKGAASDDARENRFFIIADDAYADARSGSFAARQGPNGNQKSH